MQDSEHNSRERDVGKMDIMNNSAHALQGALSWSMFSHQHIPPLYAKSATGNRSYQTLPRLLLPSRPHPHPNRQT